MGSYIIGTSTGAMLGQPLFLLLIGNVKAPRHVFLMLYSQAQPQPQLKTSCAEIALISSNTPTR